jgi:hypothetical protein
MFEGIIAKHSAISLVLIWKNNLNVSVRNGLVSMVSLKPIVEGEF